MRPCIIGIGGAGGSLLRQFLRNRDVNFTFRSFGESLAFGSVKGVWLDSDQDDANDQDFFGRLEDGKYPGYIISHDVIDPNSKTRKHIMDYYGHDLKVQGYDRRAEYLKAIFEIFEKDEIVKNLAKEEFKRENPNVNGLLAPGEDGLENPLLSYVWRGGLRQFTSITTTNGFGITEASFMDQIKNGAPLRSLSMAFSSTISGKPRKSNGSSPSKVQGKVCDSLLFIASLGGGTGTGFINPLSRYVRNEERAFPIFVLGVQTERGKDTRHAEEGKRNLAATIAMYDLLTKIKGEGIDCLILVDNQTMAKRCGDNYEAMDKVVFEAIKPIMDPKNYPDSFNQDDAPALRGEVLEGVNFPPVFVPFYIRRISSKGEGGEADLVHGALKSEEREGRIFYPNGLYPCDPKRADMALVFVNGFVDENAMIDSVRKATEIPENKINVYRKIGDARKDEVLILLRNPYGGVPTNLVSEDKVASTFEERMLQIIQSALDFLDEEKISLLNQADYQQRTKDALKDYFYGNSDRIGLREHLEEAIERLKEGSKPPLFDHPLEIFGSESHHEKRQDKSYSSRSFTHEQREEIEGIVRELLEARGSKAS
jgi:hypothetical protein